MLSFWAYHDRRILSLFLSKSPSVRACQKSIAVVFFFHGSGRFRYGVAEVFRHVLNGLDKTRYEPYLVITGTLEEPIHDLSGAVQVIELGQAGLKKSFFPLVKVIWNIRPDIVVSAMEHPNVLAAFARLASFHCCKLLLTSHGVLSPRLMHMWSRRQGWMISNAVRFGYPLADHLVCVSKAVKDDLAMHVPRLPEISVIYNPVLQSGAVPVIGYYKKDPGLIVTSSRLANFKKIDEAIRALLFLEDRYHLVVMGDGPERGALEALVSDLGLYNRVEFTGYVDDPFVWYHKAEIFVLPSMWEGFGNVLIESMACGCQVVANALAWGPAEVLGHGEYGYLYEGGRPEDLAAAILKASSKPKSEEKLLAYAQRFTDRRVVKEYEQLFDSLVSNSEQCSVEPK